MLTADHTKNKVTSTNSPRRRAKKNPNRYVTCSDKLMRKAEIYCRIEKNQLEALVYFCNARTQKKRTTAKLIAAATSEPKKNGIVNRPMSALAGTVAIKTSG